METPSRPSESTGEPSEGKSQARRLSSSELLAGRREVVIQHGEEQYRLRLTSNNKLILVK